MAIGKAINLSEAAEMRNVKRKLSFGQWFQKIIVPNRYLLLMFLPGFLYFVIFCYIPMGGIVIAFKDYSPYIGILKSPWVGLKHFISFFSGPYALRVIKNTLLINVYSLILSFPAPIILAILLNELHSRLFKKSIQTITYFPYFLSMAIVAGMVVQLVSSSGVFNTILNRVLGIQPTNLLAKPQYFRPIYIAANIWKGTGYGAIIYLAAIAGIDPTLYEAAIIDGAGRWKRIKHVTIPGIAPTMIILFLLSLGHILTVGIELILLLYNPLTYETADVIGTFVYRWGLAGVGGPPNLSLGAAVGFFQSLVGLVLIITANKIAKKVGEISLW